MEYNGGYGLRKDVSREGEGSPGQSISDTFQTRLQGLYCQDDMAGKEKDFVKLTKEWSDSGSKDKGTEHRLQDKAVYAVRRGCPMAGIIPGQMEYSNTHAKLQSLYEQSEQPNLERSFINLAKEWNSMERMTSEEGYGEIMGEGHEASQILITQNGSGKKVFILCKI